METLKVIPRVKELFDSTCVKQFEAMECEISDSGTVQLAELGAVSLISSVIEAKSEELEIKLYLGLGPNFLDKTMPKIGDVGQGTTQFSEDWCLELSNRFLGRLKNKLISHRCVLKMGLPRLYPEDLAEIQVESGLKILAWKFLVSHESDRSLINEPVIALLVINEIERDLVLSDYEDEDEDWFEESELEHL